MDFSDRIPDPLSVPRLLSHRRCHRRGDHVVACRSLMFMFNNTVDEPLHIASAVAMYDVGKETSGVEQPPLTRIVAGLPLYLRGVHLPPAMVLPRLFQCAILTFKARKFSSTAI